MAEHQHSDGPTVPSDRDERLALANALWPEDADAKLMPVSDQVRRRASLALRQVDAPTAPLGSYAGDGYHACTTCGSEPRFHTGPTRACVPPMPPMNSSTKAPTDRLTQAQDAIRAVLHDVRTSTEGLKYETLEACVEALASTEQASAVSPEPPAPEPRWGFIANPDLTGLFRGVPAVPAPAGLTDALSILDDWRTFDLQDATGPTATFLLDQLRLRRDRLLSDARVAAAISAQAGPEAQR